MLYLAIVVLVIFLSIHYDINGCKKNKQLCFRFLLFVLILIAGLRYRLGVDTPNYINRFYYGTPMLGELTWDDLEIGSDPLFTILNSIVLTLGGKFYVVQLIHATFVNTLIFKYIKKHSDYIFTCIFFYFIDVYFIYNMEEMRASIAIAISLYANDYLLENKWLKGIILYLLASSFHISSIILLLSPLALLLRFNYIGGVIVVASYFVSVTLKPMIEEYSILLDFNSHLVERMDSYMNLDEYSEAKNLNLFGYLANLILYVYPLFALYKIRYKIDRLIKLEPFFMLYFIIAVMVLNLPLLYRYSHFYSIYFYFLISYTTVYVFKSISIDAIWHKYLVGVILLLPMLYYIQFGHFKKEYLRRYYPYSSVIEKSIDKERENVYSNYGVNKVGYNKY